MQERKKKRKNNNKTKGFKGSCYAPWEGHYRREASRQPSDASTLS